MATIQKGTIMMLTSDSFGVQEDLGKILTKAFARNLATSENYPEYMIFLNRAVHLTTEQSEILADIMTIEQGGTQFLTCGTCLEFFGLKEKLKIGRPTSQKELIALMFAANKFIKVC